MYNNYMKKILIKLLLLIICFCNLHQPCAFAQVQVVNYSNEVIKLYNEGTILCGQGKYELAEQKYNQVLKIQPNLSQAKNNLAMIYQKWALNYCKEKNYDKAILYSKKALQLKPNDINLLIVIAECYTNLRDYNNAYEYYEKILAINPNNEDIKRNFQVVKYYYNEKILNNQLNNIEVAHNSPDSLYALIKPTAGISDNDIEGMKNILDMIWNEPTGQKLLQCLIDNNIPINLTKEDKIPCIKKTYANGITSTKCTIEVIIPVKTIVGFNDKNSTTYLRIYNLTAFVHEFGHAFISVKKPNDGVGSMEEELGASMIGYNVSLKAITGQYLDKGQAQIYSLDSFKNILADNHKNLPVYSGFNQAMQKNGIVMPYPEVYSNIPLMYKKLFKENKVPHVPSLDAYLK